MSSDLTPSIRSGLPKGVKPRPRADFIPTEFDALITTKGYKMFWSRAGICPCVNNDQTEQPDITCKLCGGDAYYYFMPDDAVSRGATVDDSGNTLVLNDAKDGVQIYGVVTALTQDTQVFEKFGQWVFGACRVSTQPENKLGYRDRLVMVDSTMTWAQVIEYDGAAEIVVTGERSKSGLRYPFVSVNQLRTVDTAFRCNIDFELTVSGTIRWLATPPPVAKGTRLSIHGTVHPVWIVMDHMHTLRDTQLESGSPTLDGQKFQTLPVQVVAKLDFLVNA